MLVGVLTPTEKDPVVPCSFELCHLSVGPRPTAEGGPTGARNYARSRLPTPRTGVETWCVPPSRRVLLLRPAEE